MKPLLLSAAVLGALTFAGCRSTSDSQQTPVADPQPASAPAKPQATSSESMYTKDGYGYRVMGFPSLNTATDPLVLTRKAPIEVAVGEPYSYEMTLRNQSDANLRNVVLTETLDSGFDFDSAAPEGSKDGNKLGWRVDKLGPGQEVKIVVKGKATGTKDVTDCATATFDPCSCLVTKVTKVDLTLAKSAPASVLACDPIKLVYTVKNPGTGIAKAVMVNDDLPAGLEKADGTGSKVAINAGDLKPGETKTFEVPAKAIRAGTFGSKASATSGRLSAVADASTVVSKPVLEITKTGPQNIPMGHGSNPLITYTITVRNPGDIEARNATLVDSLPAGVTFDSASTGGVQDGGNIRWNLGTLAPKASAVVTLKVRGAGMGDLVNKATAQAYCAEPVVAMTTTSLKGIPALLLEMVDLDDPIQVGNEIVYRITITNQGTAKDSNIRLTCKGEDAVEYIAGKGPTAVSIADGLITIAPLPILEPKAKAVWEIRMKAKQAADTRFSVRLYSDQSPRPVDKTESTNLYK